MTGGKTKRQVKNRKGAQKSRYFWKERDPYDNISTISESVSKIITIPRATYDLNDEAQTDQEEPSSKGLLITQLLDAINSARKFICLASFVIGNTEVQNALLNAAGRGVRVYLLTASENYLDKKILTQKDENDVDRHIEFLKTMQGKALIRSSRDFHLKCVLIDPKDEQNKNGFLMTCNLTGAVYKSPDIAIRLNKSQIDALFHQYLLGFYYLAQGEIREDGLGDLSRTITKIPVHLPPMKKAKAGVYPTIKRSPESAREDDATPSSLLLKEQVLRSIRDSGGELKIFAWKFDDRNDTVKELLSLLKGGRQVTLITLFDDKQVQPGLVSLVRAGAKIYGIPYFHAKGVIFNEHNRKKALIMTSNFEDPGLEYGFNAGILFNEDGQSAKLDFLFDEWCRCARYELVDRKPNRSK